jgi:uncharacterized protein Yka (UPF0111/DUF47 family)
MFSLQRLLGRGDRFFDLLEAGAEEARQSVQALVGLVNAPQDGQTLDKLIVSRRQEKQIHQDLTALLCNTFITPLEREDIGALSNALSRITKAAKKFAQRLLASQAHMHAELLRKQTELIEQGIEPLCQMVRQLRGGRNLDKVQEQNARLQQYEGEADKLMLDLLNDLYSGKYEPLQMIIMRDLIELLEKVIDRCRDAGNVIFQIVLKNS